MITQWFDPEVGSAAIPGSVARSLQRLGHDVEVLTGFPNYPTGVLYPGYRLRPHMKETLARVPVHRVALYPSHDSRALKRIANFTTFAAASSVAAPACLAGADVALVYSTPATVGAAGVALRRTRGIPFVLFIQDLWPDTLLASGMLPRALARPVWKVTNAFCNSVYAQASRIAVIAPSMRSTLMSRGVPGDKIAVVHNWADESVFTAADRSVPERASGDRLELMYAGSLGEVQGLDVAVRAMSKLPDDARVHLRLIGAGVAERRLKSLAAELRVQDKLSFEGPRPTSEMPAIMSTADAQLICLQDLPLFRGTVPSKFQAILASGQPLVVSAPGDVAELTLRSGAGIAVPPGDPAALAEAIGIVAATPQAERAEWGRRGRSFYDSELSEVVGAQRLAALLEAARSESG